MLRRFFVKYFELQDPAQARWLSMEGLRGMAVILVFFVHYSTGMNPYFGPNHAEIEWLDALHSIGNCGVDLFFVLSGFLIYRAVVSRPTNYLKYAYRRVERIYPVFLFVLVVYLLLGLVVPDRSKLPEGAGDAAVYILQNALLLPGMFSIQPIIAVAWSLSYEAFYYIVIPIVVGLLALRGWSAQSRIVLFLAIFAAYIALYWAGILTHFRLTLFIGGILLFEISGFRMRPLGTAMSCFLDVFALAFFVFGLLAYYYFIDLWLWAGFGDADTVPAFLKFVILNVSVVLLVYRCLFVSGAAARLFSYDPLRWLGNMSYTYYLMHSLGLHGFFLVLGKLAPDMTGSALMYFVLVPPAILMTVLVSVPVYLLIERPISLGGGGAARPTRRR